MKKKRILIASLLFCVIFTACAGNGTTNGSTAQSQNQYSITNPVEEIKQAEYIDVEDAIQKLDLMDVSDEQEDLQTELTLLHNCSGRFVQQSEDSKNRYTADVTFYLSKGEIYCSVDYTGYMGEIADGMVQESSQDGYFFEAFPKGDLFGREQDFKIYFGNEALYIAWGDDVCAYTLTRGNGSVESVQEYRENLEESGLLDAITSMIYEGYPHDVAYDERGSSLSVYVQIPGVDDADILRELLVSDRNKEVADAWQTVVESQVSLGASLYDLVKDYVDHVYIYAVERLKTVHSYANDEILLKTDNGTVLYNVGN